MLIDRSCLLCWSSSACRFCSRNIVFEEKDKEKKRRMRREEKMLMRDEHKNRAWTVPMVASFVFSFKRHCTIAVTITLL